VSATLLEERKIDCIGHGAIAIVVRMKMVFRGEPRQESARRIYKFVTPQRKKSSIVSADSVRFEVTRPCPNLLLLFPLS
jgi:hypothetical protein